MVAGHEVLASRQRPDRGQRLGDAPHGNVAEHPELIVLANGVSPVGQQRIVHRLDGRERPVAEANDVGVTEVQVGRKEAHVSQR